MIVHAEQRVAARQCRFSWTSLNDACASEVLFYRLDKVVSCGKGVTVPRERGNKNNLTRQDFKIHYNKNI